MSDPNYEKLNDALEKGFEEWLIKKLVEAEILLPIRVVNKESVEIDSKDAGLDFDNKGNEEKDDE